MLGRSRRRVLVFDAGEPRNAASRGLHAFLTRDGIPPAELLRLAREELGRYPGVELRRVKVTDARPVAGGFEVEVEGGGRHRCRKLVLATGLVDELPAVEGIEAFYGTTVFHCPYCDAWEWRDQPLAVLGVGHEGCAMALQMTGWSADLVLCTHGPDNLSAEERRRLALHGISVREERIERLEGKDGRLERVVLAGGASLERRVLFFHSRWRQRSDLPARMGCRFTESGTVETGDHETTCVPGLFVVGDASVEGGFAMVAAAEGARAAVAVNTALLKDELERKERAADGMRRA